MAGHGRMIEESEVHLPCRNVKRSCNRRWACRPRIEPLWPLPWSASLAAESGGSLADSTDPGSDAMVEGGEFLGELRRRSAALRDGLTTARPAAEVLADLLRRQAAESPT